MKCIKSKILRMPPVLGEFWGGSVEGVSNHIWFNVSPTSVLVCMLSV